MLQVYFSSLKLIHLKAVPKFCVSANVQKQLIQCHGEQILY